MSHGAPVLVLIHRHLRNVFVVLFVVFAVGSSLFLVADYRLSQKRLRGLVAEQITRSAEASVYNHEALLIQRDLDRLIAATSATFSDPVSMSVFLDGHPVAQAGEIPLAERWTETSEVVLTLRNGQSLRTLIVSGYDTLVERLVLSVTIVVLTLSILFRVTVAGYQRALRRLVSPLAEGINELDLLSRNPEAPEHLLMRSSSRDMSREAQALRDAINRLVESLASYQRNLRASQVELVASERRNATNEAIARTTQMLAHDVRRPFSTLKAAVLVLKSAKGDAARTAALIERLEGVLPRMIGKVEGLIADVMEIGSDASPRIEVCRLAELIDDALDEVFPNGVPPAVTVRKTAAEVKLLVERRKILRAFSNILQNAVDAMGARGGVISIEVQEDKCADEKVCLTLRNSNSHIPDESLSRVFDSFFTAKAGGTGLGLAIAKKVTEAHGGAISCESDREKGVAFHLVLPGSIS